jgi:hypothetical protein
MLAASTADTCWRSAHACCLHSRFSFAAIDVSVILTRHSWTQTPPKLVVLLLSTSSDQPTCHHLCWGRCSCAPARYWIEWNNLKSVTCLAQQMHSTAKRWFWADGFSRHHHVPWHPFVLTILQPLEHVDLDRRANRSRSKWQRIHPGAQTLRRLLRLLRVFCLVPFPHWAITAGAGRRPHSSETSQLHDTVTVVTASVTVTQL